MDVIYIYIPAVPESVPINVGFFIQSARTLTGKSDKKENLIEMSIDGII
jgi:hypothetical protein